MADVNVTARAHCKILLHAVKYPHAAVNGILLAEDNRNKDSKSLKFVDAIPFFHVYLGLSPMLEMALLQVGSHKSHSISNTIFHTDLD